MKKQHNIVIIVAVIVLALVGATVPSVVYWDEISTGVVGTYNKIANWINPSNAAVPIDPEDPEDPTDPGDPDPDPNPDPDPGDPDPDPNPDPDPELFYVEGSENLFNNIDYHSRSGNSYLWRFELEENTDYVLSKAPNPYTDGVIIRYGFSDADYSLPGQYPAADFPYFILSDGLFLSINTTETGRYFYVFANCGTEPESVLFKLEKGTEPTPYTDFGKGILTPGAGKNLFDDTQKNMGFYYKGQGYMSYGYPAVPLSPSTSYVLMSDGFGWLVFTDSIEWGTSGYYFPDNCVVREFKRLEPFSFSTAEYPQKFVYIFKDSFNSLVKLEVGEEPTPWSPYGEYPPEDAEEWPQPIVKDGVNLFDVSSGALVDNIRPYDTGYSPYYAYEPIELIPQEKYYITCFNQGSDTLGRFRILLSNKLWADWESPDDMLWYYNATGSEIYFPYHSNPDIANQPIEYAVFTNYHNYKYMYVFYRNYDAGAYLNDPLLKVELGRYPTTYTEFGVGVDIDAADGLNMFDVSSGFTAPDAYRYAYAPIEIKAGNAYSIKFFNDLTTARLMPGQYGGYYDFDIEIYLTYDDEPWWDEDWNYIYQGERKLVWSLPGYIYKDQFDPDEFLTAKTIYNIYGYKYIHVFYRFGDPETGAGLNNALIKIERGEDATPWTPFGE